MNRIVRLSAVLVPLLCWTSRVEAQRAQQHWSVLSGLTVGESNNVIFAQAGWPGISGRFLHGISPQVDIGGALTFNYGVEGLVTGTLPGFKFQGIGRFRLVDTGKVNFGIATEPGLYVYFKGDESFLGRTIPNTGYTLFGLALPFYFSAGFPVLPELMLVAAFDLPVHINFTQGGGVLIPILFGGGLEYAIQRDLYLTFNLRLGPGIAAGSGFSKTDFVLHALIGIAFKL